MKIDVYESNIMIMHAVFLQEVLGVQEDLGVPETNHQQITID